MKRIFLISAVLILASCGEDVNEPGMVPTPDDVTGIINDVIDGQPVIVYANSQRGILKAFSGLNSKNEELQLTTSSLGFPFILEDQNGINYDFNGRSINSEESGDLVPLEQVVGYWFFFPSFYNEIQLYSGETIVNPRYPSNSENKVDEDFVFAGSFPDGIPSIDDPQFDLLEGRALVEAPFYSDLSDSELVIVITIGGERFILPHRILEYHEIVNARIANEAVVISYCPLTGTSKAWSRNVNNKEVEFGVSGLLYNNNLILYDRSSDTDWSQILGLGINGPYTLQGTSEIDLVEMNLQTAKTLGSNTNYLSTNTGVNFDYNSSPYRTYRTDERITFPLTFSDNRFNAKERVLGLPFGDNVKIYRFEDFEAEVN